MIEVYWLVEAPGPHYLEANAGYFGWTKDATKALRFHSREQSNNFHTALRRIKPDLFAFAVLLDDPKSVEHGFMSAATGNDNGNRA